MTDFYDFNMVDIKVIFIYYDAFMDLFTKGIHKPLHNIISGITAERE
jgi:hypothetical protein